MPDASHTGLSLRLALTAWTLLVAILFFSVAYGERLTALESGRIEVRAYYNIIKTFRHWVATHGGVYAPLSKTTPSNPYLGKIPEREVVTPSGKILTLINPAYATRQIHEILQETTDINGHLTSLKPIRPQNAPDPWETEALMAFERGQSEASALAPVNGELHVRLMRPLHVVKPCLKCHAEQGYKVGDIRGGLSVSLPMAPHFDGMWNNIKRLAMGYGVLWGLGFASIVIGVQALEKRSRERDDSNQQLEVSEHRFRNLAEASPIGIVRVDAAGSLLFLNKYLETTLQIKSDAGFTKNLFNGVHPDDKKQVEKNWQKSLATRKNFTQQYRFLRDDKIVIWLSTVLIVETDDNGKCKTYIGTVEDISEHKKSVAKIKELAYTDLATGMPNETFFLEKLSESLDLNYNGFVASLELSGIGDIVGTFGLEAAELIIFQTGQRLMSLMNERSVASRTGERSFKVLYIFEHDTSDNERHEIAETLHTAVSAPFDLMSSNVVIPVSMGVCMIDPLTSTAPSLLTDVSIAHYEATSTHSKQVIYFNNTIKEQIVRSTQIVSWLHSAIKEEAFELFYQPQVNLKTNTIVGCEALIRWPQKSGPWLMPNEFIPIAERSNQIEAISTWVIGEACKSAASWINEYGFNIRVSVNISAEELSSPELLNYIFKMLGHSKLPAEHLEIEITETALMKNVLVATENLKKIRGIGATVAIDDFGTGHSSLAYLKRFPIDRLKIDQSFVKNAPNDVKDQEIIVSIIKLGHSLGMEVIGEGAETQEHIDLLIALGCDEVQGYYIAKPMAKDDFFNFLKSYS